MVRRIVTAFGGTVSAQSDIGRGSRFEVRLPIAEPSDDEFAKHASSRAGMIDPVSNNRPVSETASHSANS